jgi:hypothetical protein
MKRYLPWIWLLVALVVITGCRSDAGLEDAAAEATAALGVCPPGGEDCDDESAAAEEATAVPAAQTPQQQQAPASAEDPLASRDTDWVKGAEEPLITLIEYADYF